MMAALEDYNCKDISIMGVALATKCNGLLNIYFGKRVIQFTRRQPLFSERHGYVKTCKIGFGWRVRFRNNKG